MKLEDAISIALRSLWLSKQSKAFQVSLCELMRLLPLQKKKALFYIEDTAQSLYCLVEGSATISIASPAEGVIVGHVLQPGKWFGEPAALGQRPRIMEVNSRHRCHLVAISRNSIESMLRSNPEYAWNFFNLTAVNVEDYLNHSVDLLIQDPRIRLCSRLLTFSGRLINYLPPSPVNIPLSQEELAIASNMSRSTVYQVLGELTERGICNLGYREIQILDIAALAAIVTPGEH